MIDKIKSFVREFDIKDKDDIINKIDKKIYEFEYFGVNLSKNNCEFKVYVKSPLYYLKENEGDSDEVKKLMSKREILEIKKNGIDNLDILFENDSFVFLDKAVRFNNNGKVNESIGFRLEKGRYVKKVEYDIRHLFKECGVESLADIAFITSDILKKQRCYQTEPIHIVGIATDSVMEKIKGVKVYLTNSTNLESDKLSPPDEIEAVNLCEKILNKWNVNNKNIIDICHKVYKENIGHQAYFGIDQSISGKRKYKMYLRILEKENKKVYRFIEFICVNSNIEKSLLEREEIKFLDDNIIEYIGVGFDENNIVSIQIYYL